jgi:hypothetical protein
MVNKAMVLVAETVGVAGMALGWIQGVIQGQPEVGLMQGVIQGQPEEPIMGRKVGLPSLVIQLGQGGDLRHPALAIRHHTTAHQLPTSAVEQGTRETKQPFLALLAGVEQDHTAGEHVIHARAKGVMEVMGLP